MARKSSLQTPCRPCNVRRVPVISRAYATRFRPRDSLRETTARQVMADHVKARYQTRVLLEHFNSGGNDAKTNLSIESLANATAGVTRL